jgi:parvulin-like peptidyl-prolyl isomerase
MTRRLLVLLVVSALLATSCSALSVAAATVNGQKITEAEVESELDTLRDDPVFGEALKRDPDTRGQRRREILRELIYQAVAEQQARRMHVRVSEKQADKLISETARARGTTVAKLLEGENLTMREARRLALRGVRRFALIDEVVKPVKVPDSQVRQVYKGQQERFVEVHLERITVKTQKDARAVLEDVNDGGSFSDIAEDNSIDDLAKEGGDMGYVPLTALDVQVQDAIGSVVEGGLTDPIQGAGGFEIYRLVDRRTKTFDDVADDIRRALTQDERDQRYQFWLAERVRESKIVVNPKYGRLDKSQGEPAIVPAAPELTK